MQRRSSSSLHRQRAAPPLLKGPAQYPLAAHRRRHTAARPLRAGSRQQTAAAAAGSSEHAAGAFGTGNDQPAPRPSSPAAAWVQGLVGSLAARTAPAAAAAAAAAEPKAAAAPSSSSSSSSIQWPWQLQQLAGRAAGQQQQQPHHQQAQHQSPGEQRALARAVAEALRALPAASNGSSRTHAGAAVAAGEAARLLLELRARVPSSAWDGFAEALQMAAVDALQLAAVPRAIATLADDGSDSDGDEATGMSGAAAASSADGWTGMVLSGGHFVTPVAAAATVGAPAAVVRQHGKRLQRVQAPSDAPGDAAAHAGAGDAHMQQQHRRRHQQRQHLPPALASMREPTPGTTAYNWAALQQQQQQQQAVGHGGSALQLEGAHEALLADDSTSSGARAGGMPPVQHAKYEYLAFGGGGARCFAYAGALHSLRTLGLLGQLKGVSGSSGGAVFALLAALDFSVSEVQAALGTLPETETLSWLRLNSRLGLSDGEATFRQIEAAIAAKLGIESPTLADVASVSGVAVTLAATSLARRAPVYLTSGTHPNMLVRDALRASCAIPFYFSPMRGPGGDLLVDGCISDAVPVAGLAAAGGRWDAKRTLVLAVHDAAGLESPDFQGLLSGLVATVMQAGFHHTLAAGVDLLNLWPAAAAINPLQFRLDAAQARSVVAASQALAEAFAAAKMRQWEAAAAAAGSGSGGSTGSARLGGDTATSLMAGMGSGSAGSATAAQVMDASHAALVMAGLHAAYAHASERHALLAASGGDSSVSSMMSSTEEEQQRAADDAAAYRGTELHGDDEDDGSATWQQQHEHGSCSSSIAGAQPPSGGWLSGQVVERLVSAAPGWALPAALQAVTRSAAHASSSQLSFVDDAELALWQGAQQQQQPGCESGPSGAAGTPVELLVRKVDGVSQVLLVASLASVEEGSGGESKAHEQAAATAASYGGGRGSLSSVGSLDGLDWHPMHSTWEEGG